MVCSMTGFGRGAASSACGDLVLEIKSVNHRYFECVVKLPRSSYAMETEIRNRIQSVISRGKLDVCLSFHKTGASGYQLNYNADLAGLYLKRLRQMSDEFEIGDRVFNIDLARFPDVLTLEEREPDSDMLCRLTEEALDQALTDLLDQRAKEGARLGQDLTHKLNRLEELVLSLEERSGQIIAEYADRLRGKIKTLLDEEAVDENRIAQELVIYADKICIDEEMVRLKSHVAQARDQIQRGGEAGRKIDFLAQEMNREANTILSKSTDARTADIGIEMKTLIEKIREQAQNIE